MPVITSDIQNQIDNTIIDWVSKKLLDGFTNRSHQPVVSITRIGLSEIQLDENKSDRDTLVFAPVTIQARVFVKIQGGEAESANSLELRINSIQLDYDSQTKQYNIHDPENIGIIDMTN